MTYRNRPIQWLIATPIWLLSAMFLIVIIYLTLMPASAVPHVELFPHADKVVHAIMFGALATAIIYDYSRWRGRLLFKSVALCIISSIVLGGIIEVLQSVMYLGRSGDILDLIADAVGAILLPFIAWRLISFATSGYRCHIEELPYGCNIPAVIRNLYHESFPLEERRLWDDIEALHKRDDSNFHITLIYSHGKCVGFISWWALDCGIIYIEHFATQSKVRGHGVGRQAITTFVTTKKDPIIFEVEPFNTNDIANRRIAFYQRCGFIAQPQFHYIQPPYAPGLPEVPLMLMTSTAAVDLSIAARQIHSQVYGK